MPDALTKGVDIGVSSWTRIAPNTLPAMSKAAANYMNSQLIRMEASFNGYAEGIALDSGGHVSEGSGMNVFLVNDGVLYTPPLATSILPGITRDSVVKMAEDLKIPVKETVIPREMLYIVDEVFFVGTAVEITPIRSVDHIQVGKGIAGPITRRLQEEFFAITSGNKPDRHNWLTPVNAPVTTHVNPIAALVHRCASKAESAGFRFHFNAAHWRQPQAAASPHVPWHPCILDSIRS